MLVRRAAVVLLLAVGAASPAGAAAAATSTGGASGGTAAAEPQQGWWTALHTGGPVPVPAAPDAPEDGLVVEGGPTAPRSYAAVSYPVADGSTTVELKLLVEEGAVRTPGAVLRACVLTESFTPVQGGPLAEAPAYDCARSADAKPSGEPPPGPPAASPPPEGPSYTLDVAELVDGGVLSVALVPVDPTARIVLAAAGPDAVTASGGTADTGGGSTFDGGDFDAPPSDGSTGFAPQAAPMGPFPEAFALAPDVGLSSPLAPVEAPAESVLVAPGPPADVPLAFDPQPVAQPGPIEGGAGATRAVVLLLGGLTAAMVMLWAFAGGAGGAAGASEDLASGPAAGV